MGRFLKQGLVFVLVTAALYLLAMLMLCRVHQGGHALIYRTGDYYQYRGGIAYAKFQEFDPSVRYDVLVVGSSHAYRGYDPRIFAKHGVRMFNLGSSAQTPMNTYFMLKEYAPKGSTQLVIMDVYEGAFEGDGLESTSELAVNIGSTEASVGMAVALRDLRAINMLAVRLFTAGTAPDYTDSTYRSGGYAEHLDSLEKPVDYPRVDRKRLKEKQVDYFLRSLALCKERDLPLVLVSHPSPHQGDSLGHAAFVSYIDSLIHPFNVPYLDLSFGHTLSDHDHFYDHNHLDQAGVEIFNGQLIPKLREAGLLRREGAE